MQQVSTISEIIKGRRTVFADSYLDKHIDRSIIEQLIDNARWAPTHKRSEPWRFEVLEGEHKVILGEFILEYYKTKWTKEEFPESRYEDVLVYPHKATLISIVFQRNTTTLPEWEELAGTSCAVQNLWLSLSEFGLVGYWDTSEAAIAYCESLGLEENERSLGIFYLGYPDPHTPTPTSKRQKLSKKLSWNNL